MPTYFTPIPDDPNQLADADTFNDPMLELDTGIGIAYARGDDALSIATANNAELVAARSPYQSLDARLDALVLSGGNVATNASGVSNAGQKVLTVNDPSNFIVGAHVEYLLNNTTLEDNVIASIQAGVSLTLTTNIGTGGVLDDAVVSMVPLGQYLAAQAIPHAGTLMLPQAMEYANGGVFNAAAYGAHPSASPAANAVAIQAAIDAAELIPTGGKVIIPAGTYSYDTGLTITNPRLMLSGDAGGMTQLVFTGTGHCIEITGDSCTVNDLYITTSNHANAGHGIYINGAPGVRLLNVMVYSVQYNCVHIVDSWDVYTETCFFSATNSDSGYSGFYHGADSNNILHVRSLFFGSTANRGAYIYFGAQIAFNACSFGGNTPPNTATGLEIRAGYSISLRDCYFEWCGGYGVRIGSVAGTIPIGVNISGSYFNLNDNANNIGILIEGASNCVISNNTFLGNSTSGSTGIKAISTGQTITNAVITPDNFFFGCDTDIDDATGLVARAVTTGNFNLPWQYGAGIPTNNGRFYQLGEIIWNNAPAKGVPLGWLCYVPGPAVRGQWTTIAYIADDYVTTGGGKCYRLATAGGGNAANEPTHTNAAGVTEADGYTWLWIASGQQIAQFLPFGQVSHREGSGTPNGTLTPFAVGEEYLDYTNEIWYKATWAGDNNHWKALN